MRYDKQLTTVTLQQHNCEISGSNNILVCVQTLSTTTHKKEAKVWMNGFLGTLGSILPLLLHILWHYKYLKDYLQHIGLLGVIGLIVAILGVVGLIEV